MPSLTDDNSQKATLASPATQHNDVDQAKKMALQF
jgi:hypothetical protein